MDLKDKVVLVTGAGKRIGRTIAGAFADRGAAVAVHYRSSRAEADAVVREIESGGRRARSFNAQLEDIAQVEAMVADVVAAFGRLDVLVNSASVFYRKPLEEVTERDWDANLNTNLKAPFFLAKFASTHMRKQGAGKIINIGDWAGIRPYKNYLPYTVSKTGLIGLTRALAKGLAPEVQVNCVALGPVLAPEEYGEDEIAKMVAGTLTKKIGSPQDVARAVLFFCEGTDFATGATLVLDGGRLIA
ncbi:MAG TPA: SDR family oxidoreductase [Candidatus Binataceae bacterium]|nr:SDR family oxidoreductase [Candidatus Binataceae bacterium]